MPFFLKTKEIFTTTYVEPEIYLSDSSRGYDAKFVKQ